MKNILMNAFFAMGMLFTGAAVSSESASVGGTTIKVNVNANVNVVSCARGNCSGNLTASLPTVNAVATDFKVDIAANKVTDLGTLSAEKKSLTITLPTAPGAVSLYSFIPTQGELKNQKVIVAFVTEAQRPGAFVKGPKTLVNFTYDNGKNWQTAGGFVGKMDNATWNFVIEPNGDLSTLNPKDNDLATFQLGLALEPKKAVAA